MKTIDWKKLFMTLVLVMGVVSFLYGLLSFLLADSDDHVFNTMMGMFTGLGFGIIAYAVSQTIRDKRMSPEKKEQLDIEKHDERNVAINSAASAVGFTVSTVVMGIMVFVFTAMGMPKASHITLLGMYVSVLATLIARRVLNKKM